jgi:hypothetical protein
MSSSSSSHFGPTRAPGKEPEVDPTPLLSDSDSFDEVGDDSSYFFSEGSHPWDPLNWGWLNKNIHCLIRMFEVPAPKSRGVVTRSAGSSKGRSLPAIHYPPEQVTAALVSARACDLSRIRALEGENYVLKKKRTMF